MVKTCEIKPEYSKIVDCESLVSKNHFLGISDSAYRYKTTFNRKFFYRRGVPGERYQSRGFGRWNRKMIPRP